VYKSLSQWWARQGAREAKGEFRRSMDKSIRASLEGLKIEDYLELSCQNSGSEDSSCRWMSTRT